MQYELGKQYEMQVIEIRKDPAGYEYIALHDDDPSKEYRVYNILKCQHDSLPDTLYVKVKSIDAFGKIKFKQDEERLLKEHYKVGKLYAFEVTDIRQDYNTDVPYYIIEDDFCEHHYYYQGEQKYQIRDNCILEVDGFTDKGFLKLKEVEHLDDKNVEKAISTEQKDDTATKLSAVWANLPVLEGVEENGTTELKTSISFPPGSNQANIDQQLYNILKELTAFMNTVGGVLYVGIHDKTKKVIGIESDYIHLNDGEDEFAGSYSNDTDHYELKIRNTVDRLCPSLANSLLTFEFPDLNGRTYCKITVEKAKRPIFLCDRQLWIRQGNRLKLLKREEITSFVYDRMTISIKEIIDTGDNNSISSLDVEGLKQFMRELINERRSIPVNIPKPKPLGKVDYWITWFKDASWKRTRDKIVENNIAFQLPVYELMSDPILAFCYESGRISTIKLSAYRRKVNLNKEQKNGWHIAGGVPKNIFIMHATDYLVGYSIDHNGTETVKLHSISDYPPTEKATNYGSPFLPDGIQIKTFATLGAEHKSKIAHLVVTKARRTVDSGTPLNSVSLREEIEYLEKALTGKQ